MKNCTQLQFCRQHFADNYDVSGYVGIRGREQSERDAHAGASCCNIVAVTQNGAPSTMPESSIFTSAPEPERNPVREESQEQRAKLRRRGTLLMWVASPFFVLTIFFGLMSMYLVLQADMARDDYSLVRAADDAEMAKGNYASGSLLTKEMELSKREEAARSSSDDDSIACAVFLIVTLLLLKRSKRYKALSAGEVIESDPRPPVIYLRSFKDDRRASRQLYLFRASNIRMAFHYFAAWSEVFHIFDGASEEEVLAEVVNRVGPMIAIGRPGEKLPQLGAARVYVENEEWQQRVHGFLDSASLVVLRLGETEGFWWEIEQSAKKLDPRRLVLLVPMSPKKYAEFRDRAAEYFPKGLPDYHSSPFLRMFGARLLGWVRGIIYFKTDWTPVYVDLWRVKLPLKYKLRLLGRRKIVNVYDFALRPVYQQLGVEWEPPRYRAGALTFKFAPLAWILGMFVLGVVAGRLEPNGHAQADGGGADASSTTSATPQELAAQAEALIDQRHYVDAKPLAERACDHGSAAGCNELGQLYDYAWGVTQDIEHAAALYEQACDGGDMDGCERAGSYFESVGSTPEEYAQATLYFQKACNGGKMSACTRLGNRYAKGIGVAKNNARARTFYKKACDGGDSYACDLLEALAK